MKKLFGRDKPKPAKGGSREAQVSSSEGRPSAPIYALHTQNREGMRRSQSDERQEDEDPTLPTPHSSSKSASFSSLPPGASPPVANPLSPRSPSPFSVISIPPSGKAASIRESVRDKDREREHQTLRKKPPSTTPSVAALGILKALDPNAEAAAGLRSRSEEHLTPSEISHREEKREKKGFWDRDRVKEKDRERRDDEHQGEITRMIGYLTATSSEDWALVLEVCDRASTSDANAKEAVRALRREFKYGEPPAQLSAARLWAIMLRNASEVFITQSLSRKFLDTVEDLLMSPRTSPVVHERLVDVLGAAAYASKGKISDKEGFRGLWRRVKPADKPDEGVPFDKDDAMFNPTASGRTSQNDHVYGDAVSPKLESTETLTLPRSRRNSTKNHIIPLKEDMRRLLQECKIGQGNAALLLEALQFAKPEDLTQKEIIREFYLKCRASQELIFAQIPWASAGAERSRVNRSRPGSERGRTRSLDHSNSPPISENTPLALTQEEQLLAALLTANETLLEALRIYDDLERVAIEREAEERSRKDVRMDRSQLNLDERTLGGGSSSSRAPSPSPSLRINASSNTHPHSHASPSDTLDDAAHATQTLAPPPPAPHGPRSPALLTFPSRSPSPITPPSDGRSRSSSSEGSPAEHVPRIQLPSLHHSSDFIKPSAKALGKRKVNAAAEKDLATDLEGIFEVTKEEPDQSVGRVDRDVNDEVIGPWQHHVQYVYDAAAERTQQRIREGHPAPLINGVH